MSRPQPEKCRDLNDPFARVFYVFGSVRLRFCTPTAVLQLLGVPERDAPLGQAKLPSFRAGMSPSSAWRTLRIIAPAGGKRLPARVLYAIPGGGGLLRGL